jgi:flavodoxin
MKTLLVYDSVYGNTEKIARTIAGAIAPSDAVTLLRAGEANPLALAAIDLLIVGSPTQGGRPTPAMQEFLSKIPANALKKVDVTAFDTRFSAQDKGLGLRLLLRLVGYAAGRMADSLQAKGGELTTPPEGFIVEDKEGPLKEGELERAADWAKGICAHAPFPAFIKRSR